MIIFKDTRARRLVAVLFAVASGSTSAKPIAYAEAWTFMHERDRNVLQTELFYAPEYWWSTGVARSTMTSDDKAVRMETELVQFNLLAKRWNMPGAQANVFISQGYGNAITTIQLPPPGAADTGGHGNHGVPLVAAGAASAEYRERARRYQFQADFETRQFYTSVKVEANKTGLFFDRIDTFQIGGSPVAHDYDDLAVWLIAQVKKYRGMNNKSESGAFVRLFKKNVWVELGMLERRKSTAMLMINY